MALRSAPVGALIAASLVAVPLEAQRIAIPAAAFTDSAALGAAIPRLAEQAAASTATATG